MSARISVVLYSFHEENEISPKAASEAGFSWIQMRNVGTPYTIEAMKPPRQERYLGELSELGLGLSSMSGGFGDLFDPVGIEDKINKHIRLADLARAMGCSLVTGHIGRISGSDWKNRLTLQKQIARWIKALEKQNITFAVETGADNGEILAEWLAYYDSPHLRANLDPANFLIYGHDPLSSSRALYDFTVHLHYKDAGPDDSGKMIEQAPGEGLVDLKRILGEVVSAGSSVEVAAVEREEGFSWRADVEAARKQLEAYF